MSKQTAGALSVYFGLSAHTVVVRRIDGSALAFPLDDQGLGPIVQAIQAWAETLPGQTEAQALGNRTPLPHWGYDSHYETPFDLPTISERHLAGLDAAAEAFWAGGEVAPAGLEDLIAYARYYVNAPAFSRGSAQVSRLRETADGIATGAELRGWLEQAWKVGIYPLGRGL